MPEVICDTSPIQYLYQLELLDILLALVTHVLVPPAVVEELAQGRALGVPLPDVATLDWLTIRRPLSELAAPLVTDLGPGETEVLMLALELREAVVVLDDAKARRMAEALGLHLRGTYRTAFGTHLPWWAAPRGAGVNADKTGRISEISVHQRYQRSKIKDTDERRYTQISLFSSSVAPPLHERLC